MNELTLVSLFDGIGGFPLAFERSGVRTVATVEIDTAAAAVAHRHFPDAHQFSDVTEVSGDDLRAVGFVPDRGILTAGWPCQDFSVAGRRAGLAGARSGLWWEVVRILADVRPRWFVGENVPGILSSCCEPECPGGCMETHGGAMGSVLGSLGELGYGVAYRVLDAQHFGVPQQRRRVVIVGHLGAPFGAAAQVLLEPESSERDSAPSRQTWPDLAPTLEAGANSTGGTRPPGTTVDTAGSLVVAPASVARYGKGTDSDATDALIIGGATRPGNYIASCGMCGADWAFNGNEERRDWLTSHDPNHLDFVSFWLSDGMGTHTQELQSRRCRARVTHTLASEGADASEDGTGRGTPIDNLVAHETVVRRLTELECERLQGYPDDWTAGQSGAARYRQLGNSIAVPVFEWVAHRLVDIDSRIRNTH